MCTIFFIFFFYSVFRTLSKMYSVMCTFQSLHFKYVNGTKICGTSIINVNNLEIACINSLLLKLLLGHHTRISSFALKDCKYEQ